MQNLCPGQTVTLQANTGAGLSYQWFKDNAIITSATTSSYSTGTAGTYTVQVTKTNGCSAVSAGVVVTNACAAVITDAGSITLCAGSGVAVNFTASGFNAGNMFTLQLSAAGGSFASPTDIGTAAGTGSGSITGVIPTNTPVGAGYKLRVVSSDPATTGPASPLTLKIQSSTVDPISLCAVTVSSNKNLLVWEKPMTANIDSFVIYRNTQVTGVYQKIAAQEYAAFSTYLDNTADPTTQPYRYYISGENMCGEGPQYNPHRTIHLTINKGQGTTKWNLIWNGYEGFSHGTYQIWRGPNAGSLTLLAEVEANSYNSFTDLNAPTGALFYRVVVGDAPSCNPSARTTGGEMVGSNIVSNSETSVNLSWMDMNVWPNPGTSSSQLMVVSSGQDDVYSVRIVDITGRVLDHYEAEANKAIEFGLSYAPGIYTIEAFSKDGQKLVRKWVKQ